jgi:hypothetical protein
MLSPDVIYLVAVAQHQSRLQELARLEMIRAAELDTPRWQTHRKLAYQIGCLLRRWGTKLENYGNTSASSTAMPLNM